MAPEAEIVFSALVALVAACALTPPVMRLAGMLDLLDRPRGWKTHAQPTPYLGGLAVLAGSLSATLAFTGVTADLLVLFIAAGSLAVAGTLDDRYHLSPRLRVAIETGAATLLFVVGLGWEPSSHVVVNLLLTIGWVVGLINAVNLIDLMDGVATSVIAAAMASMALLAAVEGATLAAVLAAAVAGACLGFLPFNLTKPARVFLGDGGTMPIGFLAAALTIQVAQTGAGGEWWALLIAPMLVAVPLIDLATRITLRIRRGISLLQGGPDSLANRLLERLYSERLVALALATAQLGGGMVAVASIELGPWTALAGLMAIAASGTVAAIALHTSAESPSSRSQASDSAGANAPSQSADVPPLASSGPGSGWR